MDHPRDGGETALVVLRRPGSAKISAADKYIFRVMCEAAAGRERGWNRQLRSELPFISALPVADLRAQADDVARRIRELDTDIQRSNWEVDLLDD